MSLLIATLPPILIVRLFLDDHYPRSYGIVAILATGTTEVEAILHLGLSVRWENAWILPSFVLATGALAVGPGILDDLRDGRNPIIYDTLFGAMLAIAVAVIVDGVAETLARQHGA